jgi:hypothetical protein
MNIRKLCLLFLSFTIFLTGCEYVPGRINDESVKKYFGKDDNTQYQDAYSGNDDSIVELLEARGIDVPESHTSIYVNRIGYNTYDQKKAVFDGEAIGNSYNVVNADTGITVYVGKISSGDPKTGDFSSVTTPGRYYIETDYVGRSYYFTISDNADKDLFANMLDNYYDGEIEIGVDGNDNSMVIDACLGMDALIYAMQCNGDVFGADNHIVEQLLHMANDLISLQGDEGSIGGDYISTAAFCGIISMCCNEFGKYEATIEQTYKDVVNQAWSWLEMQDCDTDAKKAARFYATAQLYNLYKTTEYKEISEEYLNDKGSGYSMDAFTFYGVISYMNSKADVDMTMCTYIMSDMISNVDVICNNASADKVYNVGADDLDEIMINTVQICFFEFIIPSREYKDLLANTIDYIGGYNPNGINYMTENTNDKYFEYKGIMLFAISNILTED